MEKETVSTNPESDAHSDGLGRALYTAEEVAKALAISTSMVRQLTLKGDLPCRRIGRLVRYSPSDVNEFIGNYDMAGYRN